MLGRRGRGAEGLFQERDTRRLSCRPLLSSVEGAHGLPFIISANRASRTEMTLPSCASPFTDSLRKTSWSLEVIRRILGKPAEGPTECHQDLPGVVQVEEIDGGRVLAFEQADLQVPHEPGRRHPEIIPHHHDRLNMLAIALTKGGDQFRVLLTPPGKEPLLELIQDQQHLALGWQDATPSQFCQRINQPQFSRQFRTNLAQALEQPGFRLLRGRLDVNRQDVLAEPGQKSRLDQRRLAAARRDRRSARP